MEQYKGRFSTEHVSQLEAMENMLLHFDAFTAQDALELGTDMEAIVTTSGLHQGHDHEAVVNALCTMHSKPLPPYDGLLI